MRCFACQDRKGMWIVFLGAHLVHLCEVCYLVKRPRDNRRRFEGGVTT